MKMPQDADLSAYVWQLGTETKTDPANGNLLMNMPLIEFLVEKNRAVISPLYQLLTTSENLYQIVEGLHLAQHLAAAKVPGVDTLYAAAARFNYTSNPLIQVYLAGFYRKLCLPESFGPMLEMLIRQAQQPRNSEFQEDLNPMEEVGGTILQHIAEFAAMEMAKRIRMQQVEKSQN